MPFVKIYYPENILNEEELEKWGMYPSFVN